jgi:hypothetical protein
VIQPAKNFKLCFRKTTRNKEQKLHGKLLIANSGRKDMLRDSDAAFKEINIQSEKQSENKKLHLYYY